MAASASATRHSTRPSLPPLTLAEEQAASALSQLEQRDVAAALRLSLHASWEADEEADEQVVEADESDEAEEEEQKEETAAAEEKEGEWTSNLHDIEVPPPRLRHLQNRPPPADATPLQLLHLFLPRRLMEEFARHTNDAAPRDWRPTTASELYAFLGAHIYMGIDRLPATHLYWSQTFGHPFITSLFSRDRFAQLLHHFRVVPAPVAAAPRDPIPHVRALAEQLNHSFAAHFTPTQYLSLDEAMVAFKGRSPIKQYIPSKPHKWGYKIYCLASEDFLLHFEVYEGKEEDPSESGATYDTVMRMTQQYQQQQYVLFTDNWFTSPTLMNALQEKGIRMCGSVKRNRKGMPRVSDNAVRSLRQGQWMQRQKEDMTLAVWKDRTTMWVLYNHRSPRETDSLVRWNDQGQKISIGCPKAIHDYFYHARSVDVISQLHYNYLIGRKACRCWPRLAWWLLDMCILNAFKLWSMDQHRADQLRFREELMHELSAQMPQELKPQRSSAHLNPATALAKDHYPQLVQEDRDCVHCSRQSRKRTRSSYMCHACRVHLCCSDCFSLYHS
jgi:hypothetical protein